MLPLTPDHDFHTQLAHARLEALTVLRRAMTGQDNPPSKEAIRAAIAILRLPKHLTTTPCHAGDEPPPTSSSPSNSPANPRVSSPSPQPPATPEGRCEAHPRVSSSPHLSPSFSESPATSEERREAQPRVSSSLLNHTPTTPSSIAHSPFPIPSRSSSSISRLLARAGAAHPP